LRQLDAMVAEKLMSTVKLASALTDTDKLQSLTSPEQKQSQTYARALKPYIDILKAHEDLVYIYTLRACGQNLCFVMDAHLPRQGETIIASDINEVYEQPTPILRQTYKERATRVESEPYTDEFGTFLSAFAPLYTPSGNYIGLIGVDMSLKQYKIKQHQIDLALLTGLFLTGIICFLIFVFITHQRRKSKALGNKYKSLITHMPLVIFEASLDAHLSLHFVNDQIEPLTGYPALEFMGHQKRSLMSLIHEDDRGPVIEGIMAQLGRDGRFDVECRLLPAAVEVAKRKPIWVKVRGVAVMGAQNLSDTVPTIEGYMQNITLRKAAENKLLESERHFRTLADCMPNLLWITNRFGETLFFNKTWMDFTGRGLDEEIEDGWVHHIHPEDKGACLNKFINALADIAPFECWFRLQNKAGDYRWMLSVSTPRYNCEGVCDGYVSAATDITERKAFEAKLKLANQQMELFFKHTPAAIAVFDTDMRYLMVSERWKSDYRLHDIDLIGRTHYEVFKKIPQRWKDLHDRCLNGEIISHREDSFKRADGITEWLIYELHPWLEDNIVKGMIMFTEIITERKQLNDELEQHRDHLQNLVEVQTFKIFCCAIS
jgi:PAS domain S-box-containing protein